jgi:hypothetical protein
MNVSGSASVTFGNKIYSFGDLLYTDAWSGYVPMDSITVSCVVRSHWKLYHNISCYGTVATDIVIEFPMRSLCLVFNINLTQPDN